MGNITNAAAAMLRPECLLLMLIGGCLGLIFGALPGISTNMGIAFVLPMTYGLDPTRAMALLLSVYIGGMSGGLISAILLNIPGTPSSIATTFDGAPMAKNGDAGRALGIGILTSFVGGMISFAILFGLAGQLARYALNFGPWEYFSIGLFSLTLIGGVVGDSVIKGLLAALLGMSFAMVGSAPIDYTFRYTFGTIALQSGFEQVALMIGLFAIPELLKAFGNYKNEQKIEVRTYRKIKGFGISLKEYLSHWRCVIRSALVGTAIGILPGIGGSTASLLSYLTAKDRSRHPEEFGKGSVEGLIASETANNACIGGAMVPMMALGIPGSGTTAILLGALTIHGITAGPLMFIQHTEIIYQMFVTLFVANFVIIIAERSGLNIFVKLLKIPSTLLLPVVVILCFIGAYGKNNSIFDVGSVVVFGIVGYLLQKINVTRAPIVLGYVLCPMVERYLRQGLMASKMSMLPAIQRPISLVFLLATVISLAYSIVKRRKKNKAA